MFGDVLTLRSRFALAVFLCSALGLGCAGSPVVLAPASEIAHFARASSFALSIDVAPLPPAVSASRNDRIARAFGPTYYSYSIRGPRGVTGMRELAIRADDALSWLTLRIADKKPSHEAEPNTRRDDLVLRCSFILAAGGLGTTSFLGRHSILVRSVLRDLAAQQVERPHSPATDVTALETDERAIIAQAIVALALCQPHVGGLCPPLYDATRRAIDRLAASAERAHSSLTTTERLWIGLAYRAATSTGFRAPAASSTAPPLESRDLDTQPSPGSSALDLFLAAASRPRFNIRGRLDPELDSLLQLWIPRHPGQRSPAPFESVPADTFGEIEATMLGAIIFGDAYIPDFRPRWSVLLP